MAVIIKKQKSLYKRVLLYILIALGVGIIGKLLFAVSVYITIITLLLIPVIIMRGERFLLGGAGEGRVTRRIKKLDDNYFLINDVKISGAQIDHILICPKGVYTIETKTYDGKVYGSYKKDKWSQYLGKSEIKFYSPIKQGKKHSIVLAKALKQLNIDIFVKTIVVFSGRAEVKVATRNTPVLYPSQLVDYIAKQRDILDHENINKIVESTKKLY